MEDYFTVDQRFKMKYYLKIGNFKIDPYRKLNPIPSGTVGAINELLVCSDLLSKGYHVFRSVSQSCPCDLIILNNGNALRVEVKTGRMNKDGSACSPKTDRSKHDVLATVVDGKIFYEPAIENVNPQKEEGNERIGLLDDQGSSGLPQNFDNHRLPDGRTSGTARPKTRKAMEVLEIGNRGMEQMELEGLKKFTH